MVRIRVLSDLGNVSIILGEAVQICLREGNFLGLHHHL